MPEIIIDEEFRSLLPTLDRETFESLEANLIQNGCRDALVLWNDILIDGHNRYIICVKHDIPFDTVEKEFGSREEALIWIISNQVSRRNLTLIQLSFYRGLHHRADKALCSNANGRNQHSNDREVEYQNDIQPRERSTATRLANHYKVSSATINRDAKVATGIDSIGKISPEAKRKILSGDVKLDKKELAVLFAMSEEELTELAISIEDGTYEKQKSAAKAPATGEGPVDRILSGVRPLHNSILRLLDVFYSEWPKVTENIDKATLRTALRSNIFMLEDLFKRIQ